MRVHGDAGRGGRRLYNSASFAHAALIGALHLAGFELLAAARLSAELADDFGAMYGKRRSRSPTRMREAAS